MAAVAAGYTKGMVSAGLPAPLVSCTNERRKRSFHLVGAPFSAFLGSFQSGGAFLGRRALTIERSVISGCGQDHEPAKKLLKEAADQVSRANSQQKWTYK